MTVARRLTFLLCLAMTAPALAQSAKLSKGYRILLDRGVQLQGCVTRDDLFHLSTYKDIGYTAVDWVYSNSVPNSNVTQLGPAPGFAWSRWVSDADHLPPQGNEAPYMPQCLGLALVDEQNLNDPKVRDKMVALFDKARANPLYRHTMLFTNNFGGQVSDAALSDFVRRAKPDMLFFDNYPFKSSWDKNKPEHIGEVLPVDNIPWESELRRYRQHSLGDGIPFGIYTQTFHSVEDYDTRVYRDPSPSELRFNNNVAIAFNAKWLIGFTYNTGASSLFTRPGGDSHPTMLYREQKIVNRRLKNWSRSLVRLTPIADLHNKSDKAPPPGPASDNPNFPPGTTTSILFIKGKSASGEPNHLPIGFQNDPEGPQDYSWWESGKNDPYLRGWDIANVGNPRSGVKVNGGQRGDVIISWFKPLESEAASSPEPGEIYMMVVNALTDPHARSADDCTQRITLNFDLPPKIKGIDMLDPDSGRVVSPPLPTIKGRRQLVLTLAGGDAALFKFDDGKAFVGQEKP